MKQANELGFDKVGFAETIAPPTADFVKSLGAAAEGVLGSTQWTDSAAGKDKWFGTARDYAATFSAKHGGRAPAYHNAQATAACLRWASIEAAVAPTHQGARQLAARRTDPFRASSSNERVTGQADAVVQVQTQAVAVGRRTPGRDDEVAAERVSGDQFLSTLYGSCGMCSGS